MSTDKKLSAPFRTLFIGLIGASFLAASPIPCTNGSLSLYAPSVAGSTIACQYQDLIFTFSFDEFVYQKDPSQPALASGDRIENHVNIDFVNPALDVEGISLSPTADYKWFGQDGKSADVNFSYAVSVATAGRTLTAAGFDINATITGAAGILAGETLQSPNGPAGSPTDVTFTINQYSSGNGSDFAVFDRRVTNVGINKDLFMGSMGAGDRAQLDSFDQVYYLTPLPEPGVFVLTACGLGLLLLSRRKAVGRGVSALLVLCALSVAGHASPLCTDTVTLGGNTLDKYIAAGACTTNGILFTFGAGAYNYNFSGGAGLGAAIDPSQVNVTPLTTLQNPGFRFVGQWTVSGTQTGDLALQFSATAPGQINSATFTPTTSKGGLGTIAGNASVTNGVPSGGIPLPPGGTIPVVPGLSTVTLTVVVSLKGNGTSVFPSTQQDNAHLSNLVATVDPLQALPEPVTPIFMGTGSA